MALHATILAPLPFEIDLRQLLAALRARPGSSDEAEIRSLVNEARTVALPRALYKVAFIESKGDHDVTADGLTFISRVLRVNLDGTHRFFPFVCTSGRELEAWANAQDGMLRRFWADAINQAVLHSAISSLVGHLTDCFQLGPTSMMSPGSLGDWPLQEQRKLFALLGDVRSAIGVELTSSLLMVPTKSVSGIFFTAEETFASCQLCPREICANRRAPYEPDLFERKYRSSAQRAL